MMMMSFGKLLRPIALVLLVAMGASSAVAQINADKQYVDNLKSKLKTFKKDVNDCSNTIKRLEKDGIKEIDRNDHKAKQNSLQKLYDQVYKDSLKIIECNKQIALKQKKLSQGTGAALITKIENYVINLLDSRCNPKALASLENCKNNVPRDNWVKLEKLISRLNNFSNYCDEMRKVLEDFEEDFKVAKWGKIEEGSDVLMQFDTQLKRCGYNDRYKKRESIPFLDKCYDRILEMRKKGFENCKADYEKIIKDLTPDDTYIKSPVADIEQLEKDIKILEQQRDEAAERIKDSGNDIKDLEQFLGKNLEINKANKQKIEELKQAQQALQAKKDAIDKALQDACLYCLDKSHPCDINGNNEWLRNQVKELTDTVSGYAQSAEYKKRFAEFHKLFDNYEAYTKEIGEFLFGKEDDKQDKGCRKYTNSKEGLTTDMKSDIRSKLSNLGYYKNFYKRTVHSGNLDYILGEFEAMFKNEFKDSNIKKRYNALAPLLRGKKQQAPQAQTPKASEEPINNDRQ